MSTENSTDSKLGFQKSWEVQKFEESDNAKGWDCGMRWSERDLKIYVRSSETLEILGSSKLAAMEKDRGEVLNWKQGKLKWKPT